MAAQLPSSWRAPARTLSWLLACCALAGCAHCRLPRIDPTGERLLVPAEAAPATFPPPPGALGQWGLTVSPAQVIAPVGSQVVLIANVIGEEGFPLIREKIEWSVAPGSAGEIISPGERRPWEVLACLRRLPRKVDPSYALNYTLASPVLLDRGTPTQADDVAVNAGQAWVSVTSPSEGTSHVTALAADVSGWDRRQQTATIYWVDAQWRLPPPGIATAGGTASLSTLVSRQTDNTPLAGWIVRYEIVGGPPAAFSTGGQSVEVVTGPAGEARVDIVQAQPAAGTNQVNVQIMSPASLAGATRQLPVGSGTTFQTWTSTAATPTYGEPPATVVPSAPPLVAPQSPQGPAPPAWTPPPWTPPVATTPAVPPATAPSTASPTLEPAAPAAAPVPAGAAKIAISISGPTQVDVGTDARFEIQLTNTGTAPATKLMIRNEFDEGLEHAVAKGVVERDLLDLAPGGINRVNVTFHVSKSGPLCQQITVTAAGDVNASARHCVTATERPALEAAPAEVAPIGPTPAEPRVAAPALPNASALLRVTKQGPDRRRVGETALFVIEVTNRGDAPIQNLQIADNFETTLEPMRATEGSQPLEGNALGWKVDALAPGRTLRREIEFRCLRETPRACNRVTVTADGTSALADEACLEITGDGAAAEPSGGAAQLSVSVAETADPIRIDGTTTYQVSLTNKGAQSAFDVAVSIRYGDQLQILQFFGPVRGSAVEGAVQFPPIRELRAGETQTFELRAKGVRAGTARVQVEVNGRDLDQPIRAEQSTEVLR